MDDDIAKNKQAYFHYEIIETYEAGIQLKGTEVKSLRSAKVSLQEAYIQIEGAEAFLKLMTIPVYKFGNIHNHEEKRVRKLLLHKSEIERIERSLQQKGLTAIPLALYLKKGLVKVKIGVGKGKKLYDKRETIKKRDLDREAARSMK